MQLEIIVPERTLGFEHGAILNINEFSEEMDGEAFIEFFKSRGCKVVITETKRVEL